MNSLVRYLMLQSCYCSIIYFILWIQGNIFTLSDVCCCCFTYWYLHEYTMQDCTIDLIMVEGIDMNVYLIKSLGVRSHRA